jgi:formimidoylglutamate deiminase
VCPLTEANLGDGFLPVKRVRDKEIPLCIGSDSNVRLDPLEELRELEGIARRQELRRNVVPLADLIEMGTVEGAQALGLENWPETGVDVGHACLAGVARDEFEAALVFGCSADVFV